MLRCDYNSQQAAVHQIYHVDEREESSLSQREAMTAGKLRTLYLINKPARQTGSEGKSLSSATGSVTGDTGSAANCRLLVV